MGKTLTDSTESSGILITFEGGEGAGKSTHIRLLAEVLGAAGREVVVLREPGGTSVGEALRSIVLDVSHDEISDETELLIYEAARAQIVSERMKPVLLRGCVVLCDRFIDSTIAYQVFGRGLSRDFVEAANDFACQGLMPDRTILMRTGGDVSAGLNRATKRNSADRLESAGYDFHTRVDEGFRTLAQEYPDRIREVISNGTKWDTFSLVLSAVEDLFPDIEDLRYYLKPSLFEVNDRIEADASHA